MPVYTVHEAKTHLSKLIERAERGEEVIIARGDKPAVRMEPVAAELKPERQPGAFKGQIIIHDSFWEPLSEEECGTKHSMKGAGGFFRFLVLDLELMVS